MAAIPPICDFGWRASDFTLEATDGRSYGLSDIRGEKGSLLMFICNHCPYVRSIIERIVRDAEALQAQGIGVAAIMSNDTEAYPEDSFERMQAFARDKGFTFPYLFDKQQTVAAAYNAVCTPDFFGFNSDLELQYRGRLDESKTSPVANARRELYEAMLQIAETGRGPREQIASMGCSIKWRSA